MQNEESISPANRRTILTATAAPGSNIDFSSLLVPLHRSKLDFRFRTEDTGRRWLNIRGATNPEDVPSIVRLLTPSVHETAKLDLARIVVEIAVTKSDEKNELGRYYNQLIPNDADFRYDGSIWEKGLERGWWWLWVRGYAGSDHLRSIAQLTAHAIELNETTF